MKIAIAFLSLLTLAMAANAAELPAGWYKIGDAGMKSYSVEVISSGGLDGRALRVRKLEDDSGTFGGVGQMISAAEYAGKTVKLSGYLKTLDIQEGYGGLWFRVDKGKDVLVLDNMNDRGVTGTTDWKRYETIVHVDESATRILFGALMSGTGEMYADSFSLEIVPDETPTTAESLPKKPRNLDF